MNRLWNLSTIEGEPSATLDFDDIRIVVPRPVLALVYNMVSKSVSPDSKVEWFVFLEGLEAVLVSMSGGEAPEDLIVYHEERSGDA